MKAFFRLLLVLLVIGLFGGVLYYLYQKNQESPEVFETTAVEVRSIVRKTVATGSLKPRQEIEVKPMVSGIVEKLYHEPGEIV